MIEGGCLCGAVRYVLSTPALLTCLCHCEDCRKASGAHAVAWTFFRSGALEWTSGSRKTIWFAERERSFCGDCGTPLMFFDPEIPHLFEVSTCSLDRPGDFAPEEQCWMTDALTWSRTVYGLRGYDEASPLPA